MELLYCFESVIQGCDQVFYLLDTDGETDRVGLDPLLQQFFLGALAVSGGSRMNNQRLHICYICQQREDCQVIDELLCRLRIPFNLEGENGTAAVRQVLVVQIVSRLRLDGRMVNRLYLRMLRQVIHDLQRIAYMTLYAQRQSLQSLKEDECVERGKGCAGITQDDRTDVGNESSGTCSIREGYAVVAGVRLRDPGILAGCLPVEGAAVDDYTADGSTVATDKLGSGMNNDICAVLDRADQVRSCEGRVNYQRQTVLVSDRCQFFQICDV